MPKNPVCEIKNDHTTYFETILEITPLYEVIGLNILSARIQGVVKFSVHLLNLLEGKVAFQKGRPAYLLIPNSFGTLGIKSKICKRIYKPYIPLKDEAMSVM